MGKQSKTARASAVKTVGEKHVISDEQYIKNLRNDLDQKIYVSQEGARALLREYDASLRTIETLANSTKSLLARAEEAEEKIEELRGDIRILQSQLGSEV